MEIKNITVYVSGYTETDTTGMLSLPTVWLFSVAVDIDSNAFTALSGVCPGCRVVSVLASILLPYLESVQTVVLCRFWLQCSRGLRRRSAAARLLRSLVRIPPGHGCLSVVSVVCCQVEVSATS